MRRFLPNTSFLHCFYVFILFTIFILFYLVSSLCLLFICHCFTLILASSLFPLSSPGALPCFALFSFALLLVFSFLALFSLCCLAWPFLHQFYSFLYHIVTTSRMPSSHRHQTLFHLPPCLAWPLSTSPTLPSTRHSLASPSCLPPPLFCCGNEGGSEGQTHLPPELCNAHTFLPRGHYEAEFFEGYRRNSSVLI